MASLLSDSATRNRSNSGEDNGLPEHDRKRPRLSEGTSDNEQHLPELKASLQQSKSFQPTDASLKPTLPTRSPDLNMGTSSPTSKVTINTRPLSSQSMSNNAPASGDGTAEDPASVEMRQPTPSPTPPPQSKPPPSHDTISISSSPTGSPEIEIAEVEDFDQDPSQTKWTRRLTGSGSARIIQRHYVHDTFPWASTCRLGDARQAITRVAKLFGDTSRSPGPVFEKVKDWFVTFARSCDALTEDIIGEDPSFWAKLYLIPDAVLKRDQQTALSANGYDLIDFMIAYGRITRLMFELETRRCADFSATGESSERLVWGHAWSYLMPISTLLSKNCPLINSLQTHHGIDPLLIVRPCLLALMGSQDLNLMEAVSDLDSALGPALLKSPKFFKEFSIISGPLHNVLEAFLAPCVPQNESDTEMTQSLNNVQSGLQTTFGNLTRLLQDAVRKQCTWLTMEVAADIVNSLGRMFVKFGQEVPQFAVDLIIEAGVTVEDTDYTCTGTICESAFKFMAYHKFLRHGRMELRVCGVERMCLDLVDAYNEHIKHKADDVQHPLVKFLNRFLRQSNIIDYVTSVDSHPQIIQRSANLVGFLCVSRTYTVADTDRIWNVVVHGQDPRTVQEVLSLLQRCFDNFQDVSLVVDICQRLVGIPTHHFDARMLEFSMMALERLRSRSPYLAYSQFFYPPPAQTYDPVGRQLLFRLMRVLYAPEMCSGLGAGFEGYVRPNLDAFFHASKEPGRCLFMDEEEEHALLVEIKMHLESHGPEVCGTLHLLNYLLSSGQHNVDSKIAIIERSGCLKALVDDIALLSERYRDEASPESDLQFGPRLAALSFMVNLQADQFDDTVVSSLWSSLLMNERLGSRHRAIAWTKLTHTMKNCRKPHQAMDRLLQDFWPRLQPEQFSKQILEFAEQSISYEAETRDQSATASEEVVVIPGIERVWTIMLDAPRETLETEATDFVINQYLRNPSIRRATKSSVHATHLALIDRCVSLVLGSASRLKSFAGNEEGQDEGMTIIASPEEISLEESRFDRSLLFLRRFTEAVKGNPGCSPISQRHPDILPDFPDLKGESIDLTVQVYGNKYVSDTQRKVSVGSENTGSELWSYLSTISGFSSFTVFHLGKRDPYDLQTNTSLLEELKLTRGPLLVQKDAQTVESQPSRKLRLSSPVDEKISLHFDGLYGLLDSNDRLAKEVYDFLNITTVRDKVSQLTRSMQTPSSELLSTDRPYKLRFCTQALRSPVEVESFSSVPDAEFLAYAVDAIVVAFSKIVRNGNHSTLQMCVAYELLDTLMIAFRAKTSGGTAKVHLAGHGDFPSLVLLYFEEVLHLAAPEVELGKLLRVSFEVLLEAYLQDGSSSTPALDTGRVSAALGQALLSEKEEIRKPLLEVLLGLTGSNIVKSAAKTGDPRAPRSRYEASTIESCLLHVWDLILNIFPSSKENGVHCQEYFDCAQAILRRIGRSFNEAMLQELFEVWSAALVCHTDTEVVGQPRRDGFVQGVTRTLVEFVKLLRLKDALPSQSKLLRKIITKFLFPPLSQADSETLATGPILDSSVREAIYDLLIQMCQTTEEIQIIATELCVDLVPNNYFDPGASHERLALRSEVGYAGLRNLSNTCYLNSLWSQLFMNIEFREFLLSTSVIDPTQQKLLDTLGKVFAQMQNSYSKSTDPTKAVESVVTYDGENIDVTIQMDVDEFFNLLFDRLESQILDPNAKFYFKSLYGGETIQQIKSKECEHVSERPEAFAVLPVEIKGKYRLEDSLKAYVEGELLQGDNKYSCTACGRFVDAVKRSCLKTVPDHLIFNLKRFDYDITTGLRQKLNDHFAFPLTLDMAPYTLDSLSQQDRSVEADSFELTGIIVHSGTADSGHYYSYIRQRPSSRDSQHSWVQFNDSDVTPFDSSMLQDSCFGGTDATWTHLAKFYNAYMLFYQRSSSIKQIEQQHMHSDQLNPLRLRLPSTIDLGIDEENKVFLRSYCAQDPAHARFVRQLLECLGESTSELCSSEHEVEDRTLRLALEYIHSISCRTKTQPEMEATGKLINKHSRKCTVCAASVLQWFASDRSILETIMRNPFPTTRKAFSLMLRTSLETLHTEISEDSNAELIRVYQTNLIAVIDHLARIWDLVARTTRAWPEYFPLLAEIVDLGLYEATLVLDAGFLIFFVELITVHYSDSELRADRRLRTRYAFYLNAREKNRPINHAGLVHAMHRVLTRLDFTLWPEENQRMIGEGREQIGPTPSELDMLGLWNTGQELVWLKRIIAGRQAPVQADLLVALLAGDRQLVDGVKRALIDGLEHKSMPVAAAYLSPVLVFCQHSDSLKEIGDLVHRFAESITTIGLDYGRDYYTTIRSLFDLENAVIPQEAGFLRRLLGQEVANWGPVMLLATNDMGSDVRASVGVLVSVLLLDLMDEASQTDATTYRVYQRRALYLAEKAAEYIRSAFLSPNASEIQNLQPGHSHQIEQVVNRCLAGVDLDTASQEQLVAHIQQTMADFKARAEQVVEPLSPEWQESSEVDPMSDDFEELVSP